MKMKRIIWVGGTLVLLLLIAFTVLSVNGERMFRLRSSARKQWKAKALGEIVERIKDTRGLSNELTHLRAEMGTDVESGWIGTNLLVMTNGEWLLYRNKCVKEAEHIHDLFLARGSDGKWYYSTFHFCIGMSTLRGDMFGRSRPGSIAEFTQAYSAPEFDGHSDDGLKKTWPFKNWQTNLISQPRQ